jgi:hypothetical protein
VKTKWIIQNNLINQEELEEMMEVADQLEIEVEAIQIIPFSDEWLEEVVTTEDDPVVIYGSTRMTTNAHTANWWNPGVFFDPNKFNTKAYLGAYGKDFLNHDGNIMTLSQIVSGKYRDFLEKKKR